MGKFTSRVGRVSLRHRAIAAALHSKSMTGGVKTATVAVRQGITPRRALEVMRFAEEQGWVYLVKAAHRKNSWKCRWLVSGRCDRVLFDDTHVGEKETAQALVSAYFWGRHETL
jgi:hypothetical protein